MFLGGSTRYFTDDYLPENNNIGFHGHYDRMGVSTPVWCADTVYVTGSSNTVMVRQTPRW
jgi:hypothetical protein